MTTLVSVPCPLCGGDDAEVVHSRYHEAGPVLGRLEARNVMCRSCGFMYMNPRPAKDALREYYLQDGCSSGSVYHSTAEGSRHHRLTAERRQFLLRWIMEAYAERRGSVLDIGCSTGDLIASLDLEGWHLVGLEPSAHAASVAASRGIEVITGDVDSVRLSDGTFEAVCCISVSEHLHDVRGAVSTLSRVSRDDALIVVEVPDSTRPVAQIAEFFSLEHLSHFTRGTITRMLGEFGLEVAAFDANVSLPNLRVAARKRGRGTAGSGVSLHDDKKELLAALARYQDERTRLERSIRERFSVLTAEWARGSARAAVFGAEVHTQFLLGLVDIGRFIVCLFDSDPEKHGTRFLGWDVHPPQMIEELKIDVLVISSRHYQEEIYEQTAHYEERLGVG